MSRLFLAAALLILSNTAQAAIVEEITRVPVAVQTRQGMYRQEMIVTIFRDTERPRAPFIIYQHGRAGTEKGRKDLRRAAPVISRDLVRRGFVVIAPTRIGYGETGGPDVESPGSCSNEDFAGMFHTAMQEGMAALHFAQSLPYVDPNRGIAMGNSFGGASSLAFAAQKPPGIRAVVNLGGGMGGDDVKHPNRPCQPERLQQTLASYARAVTVPSLWVYAPNDRYWGPNLPRAWFQAFQANGGRGHFAMTPPLPGNGHTYVQNSGAWFSEFDRFLSHVMTH